MYKRIYIYYGLCLLHKFALNVKIYSVKVKYPKLQNSQSDDRGRSTEEEEE